MASCSATTVNCPIINYYPTHHRTTTVLQNNNLTFLPQLSKPRISATFNSQTPIYLKHTNNMFPCNNKNMAIQKPFLVNAINPAFFASIPSIGTGTLDVPVTHLATGIAKWLDLYAQVLTVRILLSWYPNLPWKKQPFSAVRSLCDPYLNLFRSLVPAHGTLDFSLIIGLMVLTTLSKILNTSRMI